MSEELISWITTVSLLKKKVVELNFPSVLQSSVALLLCSIIWITVIFLLTLKRATCIMVFHLLYAPPFRDLLVSSYKTYCKVQIYSWYIHNLNPEYLRKFYSNVWVMCLLTKYEVFVSWFCLFISSIYYLLLLLFCFTSLRAVLNGLTTCSSLIN